MLTAIAAADRQPAIGVLREPGSILVISCYELGHQPLGVAWPLAFLQQAGYHPEILDISVQGFDPEKVARARFVAISVPMHTALRLGVRLAERIRAISPACHLCFYGLYANLNADYLLDHGADSVIGGEGEAALLALVQALEAGAPSGTAPACSRWVPGAVAGVGRKDQPAAPVLQRLPFPVPSRELLPALERYARLEHDGTHGLVGYVEASRGCLHMCLHCPIPPVYEGRFFVVPRAIVLEDIRRLVAAGASHISFGDPDFLNGPGHSLAIVRAMHTEFPQLTFDFTAKVEHILKHHRLFPEFKDQGCLFVVTAAESLSDTVLANLEKGHSRADILEALRIVQAAGITLRPTWVPFTPWATLDDYLEILQFVEAHGLIDHVDPVQYTIRLLIPPGSLLLTRPAIRPFLGALDEASFTYLWTHPDPCMDRLQRDVSQMVEEATRAGEDPAVTFFRVGELARIAAGKSGRAMTTWEIQPDRKRAPRLTEPWFC